MSHVPFVSATKIKRLPLRLQDALRDVMSTYCGEVFPCATVAVFHHGELLMDAAWGWIDPEIKRPVSSTAHRYDLASVTKLFTTTAFLALVSKGVVTLDTPVVQVIPEFGHESPRPIDGGQNPHTREMQAPDPAFAGQMVNPAQVTFRHLLTHTSGLAPWRAIFAAAGSPPPPPDIPDLIGRQRRWARGLEAICSAPFVGQPDGIVRYSDLGLMLLGEAVARLHSTSAKLEDAIRHLVLAPLGISDLNFNPVAQGVPRGEIAPTEFDALWRKRRVWGEVHDENACGVGGVAGHAGLFGTARSIASFGQAWLENPARAFQIDVGLAEDAKREHAVTGGNRRGLGFQLRGLEDPAATLQSSERTYGHTGFTGTSLWIDPEARLVVACLTNYVYMGREKEGLHEFRKALHGCLYTHLTARA